MRGASPIEPDGADVFVTVRVQPRPSRQALRIEPGGPIRVSVSAPPAEGAANEAIVAFLSEVLLVPQRSVTLHFGQKGRTRKLKVSGLSASVVSERLANAARPLRPE